MEENEQTKEKELFEECVSNLTGTKSEMLAAKGYGIGERVTDFIDNNPIVKHFKDRKGHILELQNETLEEGESFENHVLNMNGTKSEMLAAKGYGFKRRIAEKFETGE